MVIKSWHYTSKGLLTKFDVFTSKVICKMFALAIWLRKKNRVKLARAVSRFANNYHNEINKEEELV